MSFAAKIRQYIRKHRLIAAGERVGVAVSGGADSVALLRALMELRGELGCVLAVVHFNHKIRAEASDEDAAFVEQLGRESGLEFFGAEGDVREFAREKRVSLETAARKLRYESFSKLALNKIATAHTLDDQAETVLMKLLRGAGTKGLSGIWPYGRRQEAGGRRQENLDPSTPLRFARDDNQSPRHGPSAPLRFARNENFAIIRPMLGVRRREVEEYLRRIGQEWHEDASNLDVRHTRNKVRHELLLLLEREYNPNIYQQLAGAAEVARAEEEYWAEVIRKQEAGGRRQEEQHSALSTQQSEKQGRSETRHAASLRVDLLLNEHLAVRRRVVRAAFERVSGKALDFEHTDALVRFLERRESSLLQLPERWFAVLDWPRRTVSFEERAPARKAGNRWLKTNV